MFEPPIGSFISPVGASRTLPKQIREHSLNRRRVKVPMGRTDHAPQQGELLVAHWLPVTSQSRRAIQPCRPIGTWQLGGKPSIGSRPPGADDRRPGEVGELLEMGWQSAKTTRDWDFVSTGHRLLGLFQECCVFWQRHYQRASKAP